MGNFMDRETPKYIWLLLGIGEGGSHVWCDDPDPDGHTEPEDAIKYVRVDEDP